MIGDAALQATAVDTACALILLRDTSSDSPGPLLSAHPARLLPAYRLMTAAVCPHAGSWPAVGAAPPHTHQLDMPEGMSGTWGVHKAVQQDTRFRGGHPDQCYSISCIGLYNHQRALAYCAGGLMDCWSACAAAAGDVLLVGVLSAAAGVAAAHWCSSTVQCVMRLLLWWSSGRYSYRGAALLPPAAEALYHAVWCGWSLFLIL